MKRTTYIKSVTGFTLHMTDGTAWEVIGPPGALRALPTLLPSLKVETDDLGPDKTVTVLNSGQVMKARKLRAVA